MKHVVMFSSGGGSWAAARRVADEHGTGDLHLVFSDVGGTNPGPHDGEDEDNYRFLADASADILGNAASERTHVLVEGRTVWDVFFDRKMIGNTRISNCSQVLKQQPARRWLEENADPSDSLVYVGIDWTETHRLPAMERHYLPWGVRAPLCDPPYLDKEQVLAMMRDRGIRPPRMYEMGFSHANCGGFCVRQGQGGFLNLLEKIPERYAYHEAREQEFREKSGKDVAILRDRRGGVTRPLTLRELRERAQGGGEVDRDDIGGCGCFTSE